LWFAIFGTAVISVGGDIVTGFIQAVDSIDTAVDREGRKGDLNVIPFLKINLLPL
jgi:hypothetical protein